MVSVADNFPDRHFLLIAVWSSGVPSAAELAAVRKLFPETSMQPPAALRARVQADGRWAAGVCPRWRLSELVEQASSLGLKLDVMELD